MKKLITIIGLGFLLFLSGCSKSENQYDKYDRTNWKINKNHIINLEGKQFYTIEVNSTKEVVGLIPI